MSFSLQIKYPIFLRRLFAEGAFSQAFVPVLTEYHAKGDKDKTRDLIAKVSGTLGVLVSIVTIAGVLGSGVITAMFRSRVVLLIGLMMDRQPLSLNWRALCSKLLFLIYGLSLLLLCLEPFLIP